MGWTTTVTLGVLGLLSSASAATPDDMNVIRTQVATGTDSVESWQPCETCEWAIRSLQDFVADPQHQEQLAEVLDSLTCFGIPADLKDQCDDKVAEAVKQAVHMFEDYISPATMCKPVCPDAGMHSQDRFAPGLYPGTAETNNALSTLPVPDDVKMTVASAMLGSVLTESVSVGGNEMCEFCRLTVMEVREKISDPQFQHEAETYAKTLCKSLGDYKSMCIQYVDEYGPIAFALAEDYLDPTSVCGAVHACPMHPTRAD